MTIGLNVQKMKMKNLLFLLLFALGLLQTCIGQTRDEKAILDVFEDSRLAWNQGDIAKYVSFYAPLDSTRMILKNGAVYGKENILEFYKKYWPNEKMGHLDFDGYSLDRLSKDHYYVTGYFHVSYPEKPAIHGRFTVIMKKIKSKWFIYTDYSG